VTLSVIDARELHRELAVIDLHADTPKLMAEVGYDIALRHERRLPRFANYLGHVDLPRLREGGVSAQIFGLWTFPYPERGCAESVHRQLDALHAAVARSPGEIVPASTPAEIEIARASGAIAALTGIEGGQALEGDLANVEAFARRGVRAIGLLHFTPNALGQPAKSLRPAVPGAPPTADDGLTGFGRDVIREMNRLGVIVDLAHINRRGFFEALALTTAPVMVTHTGVAGVHDHWRNIDDQQLRAVADGGGCVGVIFTPRYLGGPGLDAVCDHLIHIIDVAGDDLPALGSDFDGFVVPPCGLEDVSMMPHLTAALSARGLSDATLRKILGENALRVLGDVPPRQPA
jgi:membrane dipeptidase